MTGATLSRCWDFMFSMRIARILKVPCVMSGQNSGLWGSKFTERLVAKELKYAKAVTLRDAYAVDNLKALGIEGAHIFTMFDDALFCEKSDDVSGLLVMFGIGNNPYIALNIHYWGANTADEQRLILDRLGHMCGYMHDKTKMEILLVPMSLADVIPIENFLRAYPGEFVKAARFEEYDFRVLRGLLAKSAYCVTMKHHPIIFSIGECVPTLSIAYKPYYVYKNKGALEVFDLGKYSLDMESITYFEEFKALFDDLVEHRNALAERIRLKLEELKPRRERLFKIIDSIIKR